jgi:hypothetical protein
VVGRFEQTLSTPQQQKDYALRMLQPLFAVVRVLAARRSLKHATRTFPEEYQELFTEISHAPATGRDRAYVESIVDAACRSGFQGSLTQASGETRLRC